MMWNGAFTGMTKLELKVVCDSGPIIHLDELDCLHLLEEFQQVLIPDAVRKEIERHRPLSLSKLGINFILSPGDVPKDPHLFTLCHLFALDAGEMEALSLMERNPQALFLTDDASARMVAEQMGFKVHGTIGIIIRSIRRGQMEVEKVLDILQKMPFKSSLYMKSSLLNEIIQKIRQEFNL